MGAEFETFVRVLVAIAAGIVAIGGAYTFIEHLVERASIKGNRVAEKVTEHERAIEKHAEYLDKDKQRLDDMEHSSRLIMRGLMQIMTHELDGNHTEQLKQVRDEMNEYLINR